MITFVVFNYDFTAKIRGGQVANRLMKAGYDAQVIYEKDYLAHVVESEVVVVIKKLSPEVVETAKRRGSLVVYDILDNSHIWRNGFGDAIRWIDGALFPSPALLSAKWGKPRHCAIIHHHWDYRYEENNAAEFRAAYIGAPENIEPQYQGAGFEIISDMKGIHKTVKAFNCHICVRSMGSEKSCYKPCSKLVTAAACMANIVLTPDPSNTELLSLSYPYYTGSSPESVKATIAHARDTHKTDIWYRGLEMIRGVRERTALDRIIQDYIIFFERIRRAL